MIKEPMSRSSAGRRRRKPKDQTAAWRKAKQRMLREADVLEVTVLADRSLRDKLVEAGRLAAWDDDDKDAVSASIQMILDSFVTV